MIAVDGHSAAQAPHPAQIIGSMDTWSPAGVIAPVGQMSRQLEHPTCPAREWAQRLSSNLT